MKKLILMIIISLLIITGCSTNQTIENENKEKELNIVLKKDKLSLFFFFNML